jgi:hypothetical protein
VVAGTVIRGQSVGALRILSAIVAHHVVLHGFVVEDLEGGMQVLEIVGREVRDDIFVVDHTVDVGNDEVQVRGEISVADSGAAVQVERSDL